MAVNRRRPVEQKPQPKHGLPNPRPPWMTEEMGIAKEPFKPRAVGTFSVEEKHRGPAEQRGPDMGRAARRKAPFDKERK